jgi:hypothetical protein
MGRRNLIEFAVAGLAGSVLVFSGSSSHSQNNGKASPVRGFVQSQTGTLKERLSDKATDEQRVNNCKVPLERRGSTARPDLCGRDVPPPAK